MRLLRLKTDGDFSLVEFVGKDIPRYAVLSHTWGADEDEVTFKDLVDGTGKSKDGYKKIRFCGNQAVSDGLQFFWVDTCCIDKSSSAELSEAINSMFRWYRDAARSYVYLSDVSVSGSIGDGSIGDGSIGDGSIGSEYSSAWKPSFTRSRWFTRGWTLQELIAPTSVEFFSKEGRRLGDKRSLEQTLYEITNIPIQALQGGLLSDFSVNERILWAAKRQTKREEDKAYSLLGVFNIHMPLIYGEGEERAFVRLQREIKESWSTPPLVLPTEQLEHKLERIMHRLKKGEKKTITELLNTSQRATADLKKCAREKADLEDRVKVERLAKEELEKNYNELRIKHEILTKSYQENWTSLHKSLKAHSELLISGVKNNVDKAEALLKLRAEASGKAEEEKARGDQESYNKLKAKSEKQGDLLKAIASKLKDEKAMLEKVKESYGNVGKLEDEKARLEKPKKSYRDSELDDLFARLKKPIDS